MLKTTYFRRVRCYSLLLVVVALISGMELRGQEARIKLAVVGLTNPSTLQKSNIGNALVDILDSQISAVGKYTLLERAQLEELKKELSLGQSGLANAKSFAQKGGITGANFLLLGKVSDYTYKEVGSRRTVFVPGAGVRYVISYDHIGHVRVDIRLVDVRTGEDVRSISGDGTAHVRGNASYQNEWNLYISSQGQGTLSNLQSLLTNAAHSAIQDAVNKLNDMEPDLEAIRANQSVNSQVSSIGGGKILAVLPQGQFVIGVPSTAGLKVGDRFRVIAEVPLKDAQGVVVYKEKHDVGTLQVTNISESNRALATLVKPAGTAASGRTPTENDAIEFDQAYGKSLRGMAAAGTGNGAASNGAGGTGTGNAEAYIRRGDRYLNQQEYSEALTQFRQGLQVQPTNTQLLSKKSFAEVGLSDFADAEDDANKAIESGGSFDVHVFHNHAFGHCEGSFIVGKGKVSFQPTTGHDGFTVTSKHEIAISQSVYTMTNVPELVVHWQSENGKRHRYYMVFTMFLTPVSHAVGLPYKADNNAVKNTRSLDGMIVRLVNGTLP